MDKSKFIKLITSLMIGILLFESVSAINCNGCKVYAFKRYNMCKRTPDVPYPCENDFPIYYENCISQGCHYQPHEWDLSNAKNYDDKVYDHQ
ncbi:hypothetical protein DFA_07829 [Cavenderia fasciculata]|uniref:Uncharacterized protein n=1 Tax=Cavenderia fasciculata TaxID=261658 RepID=F4Q3I1_CACFS|nr:uncharacterized protein DFA_07829 [Cavenderia fasciculata]EGG16850.1 hypothetical protein DFA_07829 [Cavenderia fasciculata]|eukprot:XP_004355324.1 hypothetical protein DFA_07829 [Cavenderia fasciculata]